jgi:hypothetical protein
VGVDHHEFLLTEKDAVGQPQPVDLAIRSALPWSAQSR